MPRNDPNKVLRTLSSATVNARDYKQVLADATGGAITLTLISPGGLSEWSIKVKNVAASGSDVTIGVAGGGSFSFTLPPTAACIIEQDDLGVLHVFGATAGSSSSGVSGVTGTAPISSTGGATPDISLDNTAVTPGAYTSASITVDQQGRITAAASGVQILHQVTATLTNAQVIALPTTPVTILAAPGANKLIILQVAMLHLKWVADYTNINASASLKLDSSANYNTTLIETTLSGMSALLAGGGPDGTWVPILPQQIAQSTVTNVAPSVVPHVHHGVADSGSYDSDVVNKAVAISIENVGDGNLTGGNVGNELQVSMVYYILDAVTGLFE